MSSLDFDLDSQMSNLESEWRQAYETSNAARAELHALTATLRPNASALAKVLDRLERAEGLKARIMAKIERLEDSALGSDS
jgi:DNA repair ATPase RecN